LIPKIKTEVQNSDSDEESHNKIKTKSRIT